MATEQHVDEPVTGPGVSCSVCLGSYKEPKTLSCAHSFCANCILEHNAEKIEEKICSGIECPLCHKVTAVDGDNSSIDELIKSLPANYTLLGIMDNMSDEVVHAGTDATKHECKPCFKLGISTEAAMFCVTCDEFQCNECVKCHEKYGFMKGHNLLRTGMMSESKSLAIDISKFERCEAHDKLLKFYCADHSKLCCSTCTIVTHRKCDDVIEIHELVKNEPTKPMLRSVKSQILALQQKMKLISRYIVDREENMDKQIRDIPEKINSARRKIMNIFDKLEAETERAATEFQKSESVKLSGKKDVCNKILTMSQSLMLTQDSVLKHGSPVQAFIAMKQLRTLLEQQEEHVTSELSELQVADIEIKFHAKVDNLLGLSEDAGELNIQASTENIDEIVASTEKVFHLDKSVDVKVSENIPYLKGICFLSNGNIITADNKNNAILVFDENLNLVLNHQLETKPLFILVLFDDTIVISATGKLMKFKMLDKITIECIKTINCDRKIDSLCQRNESSYVAGQYKSKTPACIVFESGEYKDLQIAVKNQLYELSESKCLYVSKFKLIVISLKQENKVIISKLEDNFDCHVVYIIDHMTLPKGMTSDQHGVILVCCKGEGTLAQITPNGKVVKQHILNLRYPGYICASTDGLKCAVVSDTKGYKTINLYSISSQL